MLQLLSCCRRAVFSILCSFLCFNSRVMYQELMQSRDVMVLGNDSSSENEPGERRGLVGGWVGGL